MTHWQALFDLTDLFRDDALELISEEFGSAYNLTIAQMRTIKAINRLNFKNPEGCTLSDVSAALKTSPGATSTAVDNLVKRGILERNTDPTDRRAIRIAFSERFEYVFRKLEKKFDEKLEFFTSELSEEQLAAFRSSCELIQDKINQIHSYQNS